MAIIKICGITNIKDAADACKLGADMLGFVFYSKSKRHVDRKAVREIRNEMPENVLKAGVFVDEDKNIVRDIAEDAGLDTLQFHGSETPEYCASFKADYKVVKAFRIKERKDLVRVNSYDTDMYLMDAYSPFSAGGTGETFDWRLVKDFECLRPFILSGGLDPYNVRRAILEVVPYGVDVSTGVEECCGRKNFDLMKQFVEEARRGFGDVTG